MTRFLPLIQTFTHTLTLTPMGASYLAGCWLTIWIKPPNPVISGQPALPSEPQF